jgi:hypothetical protein
MNSTLAIAPSSSRFHGSIVVPDRHSPNVCQQKDCDAIRHPLDVIGQNRSQLRILVLARWSRCLLFVAPDILRCPSEHAQAG